MSVIRWILVCLIFFLLPLSLLTYGVVRHLAIFGESERGQNFEELEQVLLPICLRAEPKEYFSRVLESAFIEARRSRRWRDVLERKIRQFRLRFPGLFEFYVTDGNGKVVPELTDGHPPNAVLNQLYFLFRRKAEMALGAALPELALGSLRDSLPRFQKAIPTLEPLFSRLTDCTVLLRETVSAPEIIRKYFRYKWPELVEFLGNQATLFDFIKISQILYETSIQSRHTFFFALADPRFGFMGHINRPSRWESIPACDMGAVMSRRLKGRGICIGTVIGNNIGQNRKELAAAIASFKATQNPRQVNNQKQFVLLKLNPGLMVWASKLHDESGRRIVRAATEGLAMLIFAVLAAVSYGTIVRGRRVALPIRWKLLLLFGFAGGLPLLVVGVAGRDYLFLRYQEGVKESNTEMETLLRLLDSGYPKMIGSYQRKLNRLLEGASYQTPAERSYVHLRLSRFVLESRHADLMIFDTKGKVLWNRSGRANQYDERTRDKHRFLGTLVCAFLGILNDESGSLTGFLIVNMLESLTPGADLIADVSRNLGRFIVMGYQRRPLWAYFHPLFRKDGKAIAMVFSMWYCEGLENEFLTKQLIQFQRVNQGTHFFAAEIKYLAEGVFESHGAEQKARLFFQVVDKQSGTVMTRFKGPSSVYLVTGLRAKEMQSNYLLALRTDDPVREIVAHEAHLILGFGVVCAGILAFLGISLGRRFLQPIGDLTRAVEAIKERKFRHRIPPGPDDELGDLGRVFNEVLESISDLDVARIVQESLLPKEEAAGGDFRIFGASRSAVQLGGDYFDLRTLPDKRVLCLIGDVAGHGVQAAILMAMAKALVVAREKIAAESGERLNPESVLDFIQETIFRGIRLKHMMTCQVALLNPETGVVQIGNAGHNYPMLYRKGRSPEMLKLPVSFPLAPRRKAGFALLSVPLEPGDTLLLYTDGFVEASALDGNPLGYDRAFAHLGTLFGDDPRESHTRVLDWHRKVVGEAPQDDDITLLIIRRISL